MTLLIAAHLVCLLGQDFYAAYCFPMQALLISGTPNFLGLSITALTSLAQFHNPFPRQLTAGTLTLLCTAWLPRRSFEILIEVSMTP
jgi:hypothetical protein